MSSKPVQAPELRRCLLELVHTMSLAPDLESMATALLDSAVELVPCDGAAVVWVAGEYLKVLHSRGIAVAKPGLVLPASQMGAARPVVEGARCVLIVDTAADTRWQRVPGEERVRSWLGIPLVVAERAVGLVEWTAREPRRFAEADVRAGSELARHVAPLLHGALLAREMRRRLADLSERLESPARNRGATRSTDLRGQLLPLVVEAQEATESQHAFAFLLDEESGLMRCVAATGDNARLMAMTLLGDGTLGGWSVPPGRASRKGHVSDRQVLSGLGCNTVLVLPLRVRGDVVGVLGVAHNLSSRSFPGDATRVMAHLASQASLILDQSYRPAMGTDAYDFGAVVQSSPLGMGVLSQSGEILCCNSALADLLSRSSRTLVGCKLADFLVAGDRARLGQTLEEVALTERRLQVDTRLRVTTGDQRHVRLWLAPLHTSETEPRSTVAIVEDVTPLKILEQERLEHLRELREKNAQLRELDQVKSRFVANVSHELRTPVAVIKLFAALARKGRPEKLDHYLQTIEQETHRLETVVENVLDLSRMDRQALQVHPEWVDVAQTAAQVADVYAESARRRGVELACAVPSSLGPVWADKNHLVQVLTNLVDNALRYTPRGGKVWLEGELSVWDGQRGIEIRVCDTGSGISEEEQSRVFERFYRGSNNPGTSGTGLGLAIVRELLAQNRGSVALRSRVGEGSTFILRFHVPDVPDGTQDEQAGVAAPGPGAAST